MNRLEKKFKELKKASGKALIPYISAGYPGIKETPRLAELFESSGADILEIGIPFSDPIADGKTIQYASQIALKKGITLNGVFGIVRKIRKRSDIPVVLMGYLNPFLRHGLENSIADAKKSGVDGLIIPDIIPEESGEIKRLCARHGLSLVYLAAPNTPKKRLKKIDAASAGFVYIVSIAGVTGARKELPASTTDYLISTKKAMKKNPRIIGFGISSPGQVRRFKKYIDGVIVASALIDIIRKNKNVSKAYSELASFIKSLKKALGK